MPGFILTSTATILCAHGGQGEPTPQTSGSNARVRVAGQPVLTLADPYVITGCPLPAELTAADTGPCRTGHFTTGASRVSVLGQPVQVQEGASICSPTATPLQVALTQQRVTAR